MQQICLEDANSLAMPNWGTYWPSLTKACLHPITRQIVCVSLLLSPLLLVALVLLDELLVVQLGQVRT